MKPLGNDGDISTNQPKRGKETSHCQLSVPTADGGVNEFTTKEGVYHVVSTTLVKRFQVALGANCRALSLKM